MHKHYFNWIRQVQDALDEAKIDYNQIEIDNYKNEDEWHVNIIKEKEVEK